MRALLILFLALATGRGANITSHLAPTPFQIQHLPRLKVKPKGSTGQQLLYVKKICCLVSLSPLFSSFYVLP
ncbi:hypothetical protein LY78DRAFT_662815 [Colletotrichum sublineola]|nr:hypothetical protein LY78DRAFT_662815 [Colletotrichum sublineola]